VEGALVCLSQNNVYVKGFTDEFGNISLEHPFTDGEILMVVTSFNTTTIYKSIMVGEMQELFPPLNLTYEVEQANHVLLNWETPDKSKRLEVKGYNIYRDDEKVNVELVEGISYTDIAPANGNYKYEVTALYGSTLESNPTEPVLVAVYGMCMPIANNIIVDENEDLTIFVSWEAPDYEGTELAGYNVYRDDEQINEQIIFADKLSFLDENVEIGTQYCYQVEVVYKDCEEPLITEKECHTLSFSEFPGTQTLHIYPNPATGEFRISSSDFQVEAIEIYDISGNIVFKSETLNPNPDIVINISHFQSGIYFIRIDSEKGSVTGKVVIKN
jgi:hypothetical protein